MDGNFFSTPLPDRGVLVISGADRVAFLQGLITNDMTKATPEQAIYAALLTPQGKYLHDFFVVARENEIWLEGERARLGDLKQRLSRYKLKAVIEITPADELVSYVFWQNAPDPLAMPLFATAFNLPDKRGALCELEEGVAFVDPRSTSLGIRVIIPEDVSETLTMQFANGDFALYDRHRILCGAPDGSHDFLIEKSTLLENNFDELGGISWEKGCYLGQEVTARMRYRALLKKRLVPVRIAGDTPPPGSLISSGEQEAGEMRSSQGDLGLALLRLEFINGAKSEQKPLMSGNASLTPIIPTWLSLADYA